MTWVIEDFQSGKTRSRRPGFVLPPKETVTAVATDEALSAFGCRDRHELAEHLRQQRELGVLIADPGRLTKRVRLRDGRIRRCYVVRGASVPSRQRANRPRIYTW